MMGSTTCTSLGTAAEGLPLAQLVKVRITLPTSAAHMRGNRPTVLNQNTRWSRAMRRNKWIADVGKPCQLSDSTTKLSRDMRNPPCRGSRRRKHLEDRGG